MQQSCAGDIDADELVRTQSSAGAAYFMQLCDARSRRPGSSPQFIKMLSGMTTRAQSQRVQAALAALVGA